MDDTTTMNPYRERRARLGVSAIELAVMARVSSATISNVERGARSPRCEPKIAAALDRLEARAARKAKP